MAFGKNEPKKQRQIKFTTKYEGSPDRRVVGTYPYCITTCISETLTSWRMSVPGIFKLRNFQHLGVKLNILCHYRSWGRTV